VDVRKLQPKFDGVLVGMLAQRECLIKEIKGRLGDVASICEMFAATGDRTAELQETTTKLKLKMASRHAANPKSILDRSGDDHFEADQELLREIYETLKHDNEKWSERLMLLAQEASKQQEYEEKVQRLQQQARDHAAEKGKWTAVEQELRDEIAQHKEEQLKWTASEKELRDRVDGAVAKHEKERIEWMEREKRLNRQIADAAAEHKEREQDLNRQITDAVANAKHFEQQAQHNIEHFGTGHRAQDEKERDDYTPAATQYPTFNQQPLPPAEWQSQMPFQTAGMGFELQQYETQTRNPHPRAPESIVPYPHQNTVAFMPQFNNDFQERLKREAQELYDYMIAEGMTWHDTDPNICWDHNSPKGCQKALRGEFCGWKHRYYVHDKVDEETGRFFMGIKKRYMCNQTCAQEVYNYKRQRRGSVAVTRGYGRRY